MRSVLLDPGALRSELSLQGCAPNPDGSGGHAEVWAEIATLFGRIEPLAAKSIAGGGQRLETTTHRITIRWRAGVRSGMRFVKQDRVFDVVTVHDPDESGRYLACLTAEAGS